MLIYNHGAGNRESKTEGETEYTGQVDLVLVKQRVSRGKRQRKVLTVKPEKGKEGKSKTE
jgi:hypothetical protein